MIPASARDRIVGAVLVAAAIGYLLPFVAHGWVPHDEGMLGQSADRVMRGALPHVDYEETYTGGLTYLYAAVFRMAGVDLLHVRWLLFGAAATAIWLMYAVLRRTLRPPAAAAATWVATTWSFPNYFAGLPSWWLLLCALIELWAMIRAAETRRVRYVVLAAVAAGLAVTIKQTGIYLVVALGLWTLYDGGSSADSPRRRSLETAVRWAAGAAAIAAAGVMLAPRLLGAAGLYLFVPAAATALALFVRRPSHGPLPEDRSPVVRAILAGAIAAVPLALLLMAYGSTAHLRAFLNGVLILPQKRLSFASMPMPDGWWMLMAVPLLGLAVAGSRRAAASAAFTIAAWAAAIAVPVAALWHPGIYQIVWQSMRALAAVLPVVILWQIASGRVHDSARRSTLYAAAALLAWASLNQYPFAAPIYFSYTTPLVVLAAVAAADASGCLRARVGLPLAALLVLFAVLIENRGDLHSLGRFHEPGRAVVPLDLPRAHLNVDAGDADVYRRLLAALEAHHHGGEVIAGPDCPEVYFLAGLESPSGALFDFFSASSPDAAASWLKGEVIIINHEPAFSAVPPGPLVAALRRGFTGGERIGRFEIRWR